MKKFIITSIIAIMTTSAFASDVMYEPYYDNVTVTAASYCKNCGTKPVSYNLKPVTVYTGKTVTVQKHYDVYQPKVVYEKVNSYTTTKTCTTCE